MWRWLGQCGRCQFGAPLFVCVLVGPGNNVQNLLTWLGLVLLNDALRSHYGGTGLDDQVRAENVEFMRGGVKYFDRFGPAVAARSLELAGRTERPARQSARRVAARCRNRAAPLCQLLADRPVRPCR